MGFIDENQQRELWERVGHKAMNYLHGHRGMNFNTFINGLSNEFVLIPRSDFEQVKFIPAETNVDSSPGLFDGPIESSSS